MRLVVYRSIPGMTTRCSNYGLATTAHRSHVPQTCALCGSVSSVYDKLPDISWTPSPDLPITSQMYEKGLRSGERGGYGRTFTLLAYKSAIVVRAEWQWAPSSIRCIYLLQKLPSIRYKMHNSQFRFVTEFWLKNGVILWKIKLDLLHGLSSVYKQASRFVERIWNTSNGKKKKKKDITEKYLCQNVVITQNFLLLLHKILWADAHETCSQANVLYTSFGINTCQKVETKSRI